MKNLVLASLAMVILVAGCVQTGQNISQNQTGPKQFTMTISHTSYNPPAITVNRGDAVVISAISAKGTGVESQLSHNHGIAIDEYNIDVAAPSETIPVTVSFVADKAGTFAIYCKSCWDGPFGRNHPDIRATLTVNP